jgi:uncharacterized protein
MRNGWMGNMKPSERLDFIDHFGEHIVKLFSDEDITMKLDPLLENNRDNILEIATTHGAQSIRVFGSRINGTYKKKSDLDLLINLESDRTLLDIVAIKQDLEDLLGCGVDVVTESSLSPYIRDQVVSEAVPLTSPSLMARTTD